MLRTVQENLVCCEAFQEPSYRPHLWFYYIGGWRHVPLYCFGCRGLYQYKPTFFWHLFFSEVFILADTLSSTFEYIPFMVDPIYANYRITFKYPSVLVDSGLGLLLSRWGSDVYGRASCHNYLICFYVYIATKLLGLRISVLRFWPRNASSSLDALPFVYTSINRFVWDHLLLAALCFYECLLFNSLCKNKIEHFMICLTIYQVTFNLCPFSLSV